MGDSSNSQTSSSYASNSNSYPKMTAPADTSVLFDNLGEIRGTSKHTDSIQRTAS